jgi:AraC family transcriptional regulator
VSTHETLLHEGPVRLVDVTCRGGPIGWSGEETSPGHAIVFPRSGLHVKRVGRDEVVADPSRVVFYAAHEPYRVSHPIGGGDDCTVLAPRPDVLRDLVGPKAVDSGDAFALTHAPSPSRIYAAHRALLALVRRGTAEALAVDESALALAADVVDEARRWAGRPRAPRREDTVRAHRALVADVLAIVAAHFRERLALADLANAVHTSPFHLARVFARDTGSSIHRHQTSLRLREALERLDEAAGDLTALALGLGFSSHAHFSDAFRREFGCAPSAARAMSGVWHLEARRRVSGRRGRPRLP